MATSFEPRGSLRSSQNRPPSDTLDKDKKLPNIDFGFDDLKRQMDAFTLRFDGFIADERTQVLSERNEHRSRLAELQENTQLKARSISLLEHSASTHASTLQKEAAETAEMQSAITSLSSSRDTHAARNASLASQIASTKAAIATRLQAQQEYSEKVAAQARLNAPELAFYEEYLGLRIESPADDEIAFVFNCLDERDPEREFEVVLDLSRRDYAVKKCRPKLAVEEVQHAVDKLNEGRDLAPFLKDIRVMFRKKSRE